MKHWRILNAEPENYSQAASELLRGVGDLRLEQQDRLSLLSAVAEVDALIVRLAFQIDRQVFEAAPNLRAVVSATTGLDHIDLTEAEKRGVKVLSLRGEVDFLRSIPATAELTWGLLLALSRNIPKAFAAAQTGVWERDRFKGHDLAGKRLGILGLGRIGTIVARYGLAFGMQVMAYDPAPQTWVDGVKRATSMDELLRLSEVFSIHVPLLPETTRLVGEKEINLLPDGAYLINTSRGDIVDEDALLSVLKTGRLAGAGLDVLSNERTNELGSSSLLQYSRKHDNLIITPHIGGATYESMAATEIFMAQKLVRYLKSLEGIA